MMVTRSGQNWALWATSPGGNQEGTAKMGVMAKVVIKRQTCGW